ncbi:MAG: ATP-binding cassette domain-containing protein [Candidatus Omnitrophica bacterium]|nr:ATP-binding cassette domain-containing protein [Candidatus Omnitrophota bacterium]
MFFKTNGLNKDWGGFSLKDISLEMEEGQYFVILGPCGAGKTLLLNAIAGLYRPDSGSIFMQNQEITFLPPEKRNIGYLFQKDTLFTHLSVKENIYYGLKYHRPDKKYLDTVFQLLDIGDLLSRRDTVNLSGGEARKVVLARSLAVRPRLLLLDEPLSFLDPLSQEKTMQGLKSLNKEIGLSIIHVTHDVQEIKGIARDVAILFDGAIAQSGAVEKVLSEPLGFLKEKFWGKNHV